MRAIEMRLPGKDKPKTESAKEIAKILLIYHENIRKHVHFSGSTCPYGQSLACTTLAFWTKILRLLTNWYSGLPVGGFTNTGRQVLNYPEY
jgi:hypothetical protein